MPTHIENELGLAPTTHRLRRWFRRLVPSDSRSLDPLTVNYEAWRAVRQHVREWPHYLEAPNCIEVLVSPEDWEDYWGIDSARKEAGVSAYVRARAADKGYWMAGEPVVLVEEDETIEAGEVVVSCQFVEPVNKEEAAPLSNVPMSDGRDTGSLTIPPFLQGGAEQTVRLTAEQMQEAKDAAHEARRSPARPVPEPDYEHAEEDDPDVQDPPTLKFVDASRAGVAFLVDDGAFRLEVHSGDCIGAVSWGEDVPPEVNVRLDAEGFPYVESMQCTIAVHDGRWTVTNHATRGTRLTKYDGRRFMLGEPEPCPLDEGDVLWLGPKRPLTFVLS